MALVSIFRPTSHLPSQLCSPRSVAFWMAHLALSVALATMVLAMSSTMVAMATGRRWGVGLGSSESTHTGGSTGTEPKDVIHHATWMDVIVKDIQLLRATAA